MPQHYSDPTREAEPHALPDVEVFYVSEAAGVRLAEIEGEDPYEPGWYWWTCLPGCLPASEPAGPFPTEAEALADAQDY